MNSIDLAGRCAVVTGGARGVGFAIAKRFLASGARVALWDLSDEKLRSAASELLSHATSGASELTEPDAASTPDVLCCAVDVSNFDGVLNAVERVRNQFSRIDILVNSAGVAGVNAPLVDYPLDVWSQVQKVNLDGTFHTCRAIAPAMCESGYGRIVNIASMAGKDGNPNASAYSVSKAGVIALTKSLGKELANNGVLVNAIAPAVIRTEMLADVSDAQIAYMVSKIPMGRMGTVDEIAALASWLSSAECSYSTGAVFDLSGGRATY